MSTRSAAARARPSPRASIPSRLDHRRLGVDLDLGELGHLRSGRPVGDLSAPRRRSSTGRRVSGHGASGADDLLIALLAGLVPNTQPVASTATNPITVLLMS